MTTVVVRIAGVAVGSVRVSGLVEVTAGSVEVGRLVGVAVGCVEVGGLVGVTASVEVGELAGVAVNGTEVDELVGVAVRVAEVGGFVAIGDGVCSTARDGLCVMDVGNGDGDGNTGVVIPVWASVATGVGTNAPAVLKGPGEVVDSWAVGTRICT